MSRTTSTTARTAARRLAATSTVGALALALTAAPALAAGPVTAGPLTAGPVTAGPVTAGPVTADATSDPTGGTVTITVDAAALAALCDDRIPQVTKRATDLLDRIEGDASTTGSAAWLSARADTAAAQGHDDLARRLQFRSEQRLGHVDEITALVDQLGAFEANVCSQVAP